MIPYDIDPSLHSSDPAPEQLDDGFSRPSRHLPSTTDDAVQSPQVPVDPSLWVKSSF